MVGIIDFLGVNVGGGGGQIDEVGLGGGRGGGGFGVTIKTNKLLGNNNGDFQSTENERKALLTTRVVRSSPSFFTLTFSYIAFSLLKSAC